jgi:hypothetical protein
LQVHGRKYPWASGWSARLPLPKKKQHPTISSGAMSFPGFGGMRESHILPGWAAPLWTEEQAMSYIPPIQNLWEIAGRGTLLRAIVVRVQCLHKAQAKGRNLIELSNLGDLST